MEIFPLPTLYDRRVRCIQILSRNGWSTSSNPRILPWTSQLHPQSLWSGLESVVQHCPTRLGPLATGFISSPTLTGSPCLRQVVTIETKIKTVLADIPLFYHVLKTHMADKMAVSQAGYPQFSSRHGGAEHGGTGEHWACCERIMDTPGDLKGYAMGIYTIIYR